MRVQINLKEVSFSTESHILLTFGLEMVKACISDNNETDGFKICIHTEIC